MFTEEEVKGAAGIVADGGFRDSHVIAALPFPSFQKTPSAPTNLTLNQALNVNVPIGCGDIAVFPGDIIVGDDDGIMIISAHLADKLANEAKKKESFEKYVTVKVAEGSSIIGLYPLTSEDVKLDFEKWKKKNGLL